MQARAFRFDSFRFSPRKPRSPLLRVLFSLVGLALLALLVFFGLFVGAAMLAFGLLRRAWRPQAKVRASQADVLDGEYRVVNKPGQPALR